MGRSFETKGRIQRCSSRWDRKPGTLEVRRPECRDDQPKIVEILIAEESEPDKIVLTVYSMYMHRDQRENKAVSVNESQIL